jgi:hypothetical protein
LDNSPTVVVSVKSSGGAIAHVTGVDGGANFVQGNPSPGEFDIGHAAQLADTGDSDEFAPGDRNAEYLLVGIAGHDERPKCIHSSRRERNIPARRRRNVGRTAGLRGGNPSVMLQGEIFSRKIVRVGNDAGGHRK